MTTFAALWLYHRALGFAYFNDDPTGHFAWMEGRTLLGFFISSAEYGYYRPVVFAVLRLTETLFGNATFPHNPVADHALLWLLHGANAALVWLLARRLSGSAAFASAAALVFAATPFSYEAVAYVASLTHPLLLFWLLLTLLVYERGRPVAQASLPADHVAQAFLPAREKGRRGAEEQGGRGAEERGKGGYRLLALMLMTLGLLTHENGLFIFPALVGLDWVRRPHTPIRQRARALWPFAVPPLLFAILWVAIPKNSQQGLNSLSDIARNIAPFLQTLAYPLLPALGLGSGDAVWLVAAAAVVVVAMGLLAWRAGAWRLWVYALGWIALSAAPALLFLGPAYVFGSPRLSYLPSVGVGLLWGMPVLWLSKRFRNRVSRNSVSYEKLGFYAITILYILALVLPPLPFIRCQLDFYDEASRFARAMAGSAAEAPAGREVVFVNAPFFFSSTAARPEGCPSPYPRTPVGVVLIPPYAQARDFVRFNGGPDRDAVGVTFPGYSPGWRTFGPEIDGAALRQHAADDAAYVFDLLEGTFADLSAAWQPDAAGMGQPAAMFGGLLALLDARTIVEGGQLTTALEWRVVGAADMPLAAFVHVYDARGALVAQSDGPPGDGLAPQSQWQAGDGLLDQRRVDLSVLPPGAYRVVVGVYNAADGARLAAEANGQALEGDIFEIHAFEHR